MKKYFTYELKRNLLPLAVFTAIACLICAIFGATSYIVSAYNGTVRAVNSVIGAPTAILCILCTIVPVMQFSYRMETRSADLWLSLPVKREKQLLVRLLVGLLLAFIPYTAAYWVQFFILLCRENAFDLIHYLSYYAASLPLGALLFGVNSFVFSRANTVWDGLAFLLGWSFLLAMPFLYLNTYIYSFWKYVSADAFITYAPLNYAAKWFDGLICGNTESFAEAAYLFPVAAATGIGAYAGLFLYAGRDKAESAGQISDSPWGYKTLLPLYVFFFAACNSPDNGSMFWILSALILVLGFALYVLYRRSFRLKKQDVLLLLLAFAAGVALACLGAYVIYPATAPSRPAWMPEDMCFQIIFGS